MPISTGPRFSFALVLVWEPSRRIDTAAWTEDEGAWYIAHPEGEPSKVEEEGVELTEAVSQAACQSTAATWFFDSVNGRLYVHPTTSKVPSCGDFFLLSSFFEYYASHSPIICNGKYASPRLLMDSIPEISISISAYHQGGTQQGFGTVKLANADGFFDSRLSTYIYEAKFMQLKIGNVSFSASGMAMVTAYGDYQTIWSGWSGDIQWTDEFIAISTEDLRRIKG